jgi:DNA-binding NtrC family response regulator
MSRSAQHKLSQKKKLLVYLVDDEPVLLDVAEAALQAEGYVFKKFHDPQAALASFRKARNKPAVLITDYAMGKMNGLELIQRCRQLHPGLKTILISGTAGAEIVLDAPVQVDRFLAKPYQSQNLAELVRRVLASHETPGAPQ